MRGVVGLLVAVGVVSAVGCRDRGGDGEGGSGGSGGSGGGSIPPTTAPAASAVVEGSAAALALSGPLLADGDQLRREKDSATDGRARDLVENGVAGNSIVTDGTCVTFDWAGLTVTIRFTGCTLEATGLPVSGTMVLAVTINPTSFGATFDGLTIGQRSIEGSVVISFLGDGTLGRSTDADLTFTTESGVTHLVLQDATAEIDPQGTLTASGSGSVTTSTVDATFEIEVVSWAMGDRCPSAGTLVVDDAQAPAATITFLPTTPVDGIVEVKVGALPAQPMELSFCAP